MRVSPSERSPSLLSGVSSEIVDFANCRASRTSTTDRPNARPSSAAVGSRPHSWTNVWEARLRLPIRSDMWVGTRMVRARSATARLTACWIHHVAYVENLKPRRYSNLSTARMSPMLPS